MKTIVVGFSASNGPLSKVIRFATKSKVSHAYVRVLVPEYKTSIVFQAAGLSVNYCNGDMFDTTHFNIEEYEISVSDEQCKDAERQRVTETGKPYAIKQLFGFFFVLAMRKIGKKVANPMSDGDHSYVCVEIVARQVGISDGESMTPEDLRRWCEKNGKLVA